MNNDLISRSALLESAYMTGMWNRKTQQFDLCVVDLPTSSSLSANAMRRWKQLKAVDVNSYFECAHCKHEALCDSPVWPCNDCDNEECPCHTCSDGSNWQWRGVQEVQHGTE